MIVSISDLKARLVEIVRDVERDGTVIDIEHHGRVVAWIIPATAASTSVRPWEALHGMGILLSAPEESVLKESDFGESEVG